MRKFVSIYMVVVMVLTISGLSFAQEPAHTEDKFVGATRPVDTSQTRRGTISVQIEDGTEVRYFQEKGAAKYKITQCLESCKQELFKCTDGQECEVRAEFDKGGTIRVRELSAIRTTGKGVKFTRVNEKTLTELGVDAKKCGEAYSEPDVTLPSGEVKKGLIWCDTSPGTMPQRDVTKPDGTIIRGAESYCKSISPEAEVPSGYTESKNGKHGFKGRYGLGEKEDSDFVRFRKYTGAQSVGGYQTPEGYSPFIQGSMTRTVLPNLLKRSWSSSVRPGVSNLAYYFDGRYGFIFNDVRVVADDGYLVRCVVARR